MDHCVDVTAPPKLVGENEPVSAEGGAMGLTTQLTMAVEGLKGLRSELPCDTAA